MYFVFFGFLTYILFVIFTTRKKQILLLKDYINTKNENILIFSQKNLKTYLRYDKDFQQSFKIIAKDLSEESILFILDSYPELLEFINQNQQSVDICLTALDKFSYEVHIHKHVRIVPNPDFKTTLLNLKKKKELLNALK